MVESPEVGVEEEDQFIAVGVEEAKKEDGRDEKPNEPAVLVGPAVAEFGVAIVGHNSLFRSVDSSTSDSSVLLIRSMRSTLQA